MEDQQSFLQNKKVLIIAGVVILLLLLITAVVLTGKQTGNQGTGTGTGQNGGQGTSGGGLFGSGKNKVTPTSAAKQSLSGSEVAQKVLSWLQKQKNPQGKYNYGPTCSSSSSCEAPIEDNRSGIAAIWGEYQYFKKTNDASYLASTKSDLDVYADPGKVPVIQSNFLNCSMLYDIAQGVDSAAKEKAKSICLAITHKIFRSGDISQFSQTLEQLSASTEQSLNRVNGSRLVVGQQVEEDAHAPEAFLSYVTASPDMLAKFRWTNSENDYKAAYIYLNKALEVYSTDKESLKGMSPFLGVAAAQLYGMNKNEKYLAFAQGLADQISGSCARLDYCAADLALINSLNNLNKGQNYNQKRDELVQYVIDNFFDYTGYKGYKFGQGSFYFEASNPTYPVMYNGYMAGLLSK